MAQSVPVAKSSVRPSHNAPETWRKQTNISSFIRILHLLDLNLREDWPVVTAQTFSARSPHQNLQQRIRAVEWSLYRLIELYNGQTARDKLRPFFPPQSPLQSQNLRAALLRVLTEWKSGGILSRDVVLRKSTFDECKGEQFEKLLLNVGHVVLQRCSSKSSNGMPLAVKAEPLHVLPLLIAHDASMSNNLRRRREASATLHAQQQHDVIARAALAEKTAILENSPPPRDDFREQITLLLEDAWNGPEEWRKTLMAGHPLGRTSLSPEEEESDLLRALKRRVQDQQKYAERLRSIREFLPNVPTSPIDSQKKASDQCPPLLRFDQHLMLETEDSEESGYPAIKDNPMLRQSTEMLGRMKRELDVAMEPPSSARADGPIAADQTPRDLHERQASIEVSASAECSWLLETPKKCETPLMGLGIGQSKGMSKSPIASPVNIVKPSNLADRTRMSLAGARARLYQLNSSSPPSQPAKSLAEQPIEEATDSFTASPNLPALPQIHSPDVHDLAERTRRSMALLSSISQAKSKSRRSGALRSSQLYPINPFETPRSKSQTRSGGMTPQSTGSTPRDTLFSDDADVTSVFKSRPKIAVSPTLSPTRDAFSYDKGAPDLQRDLSDE